MTEKRIRDFLKGADAIETYAMMRALAVRVTELEKDLAALRNHAVGVPPHVGQGADLLDDDGNLILER